MFVSSAKYNRLLHILKLWQEDHKKIFTAYERLVARINKKGGEAFLSGSGSTQLTPDDIKTIISLCHPDKHNNSSKAKEITSRLLLMRKKQ